MIARETHISEAQSGGRFFSSDTMIWRVDRETALLLAGGRALLMQLAHPKVAAGVADHSRFQEDPLGRLYRTMSTMWSIVFDEAPQARAALERVKNVHVKVRGAVRRDERLPAGTQYDALDEKLLLWVHATLIDSALVSYGLIVKPLSPDEQSRYYSDSKKLARLFDIPDAAIPASLADFSSYMERMLASDQIAVGPIARSLAKEILYPRPLILKPAGPLFRLITAGLLPPRLREGYGLNWNEGKEKRFTVTARTIRSLLPLVPRPLRIVPNARAAENHHRSSPP